MKNITKKISYIFLVLSVLFSSCKEEFNTPIDGDGTAPGKLTNVSYEAIAGGAVITYTPPVGSNLLYIKAVYQRNGKEVESKSSYFKESVLIEGLGNDKEVEVKLYAVSRAEKESEPVLISVKPLPPSIYDVLNSLDIRESFGGMLIKFENKESKPDRPNNIVIEVQKWDKIDKEWKDVDAFYTALENGSFSVRGLPAVQEKFSFTVRDKWSNKTERKEMVLTPVYEEKINTKLITYKRNSWPVPQVAPVPVTGAMVTPGNLSSWPFDRLFDGLVGNTGFHSNERNPLPAWFPMDLGQKVKFSRYKVYQRNSNGTYIYNHGNPHEWQLWGTNTPTDVNSWVMLDHRIMIKPSGLPLGQYTNDDLEAVNSGHEYEVSIDAPAVRYLAWKHIDNWAAIEGTSGHLHIAELEFWGQVIK